MAGLSFLNFLDTLNTQEGLSLLIHAEIWVDVLACVEAAEYYQVGTSVMAKRDFQKF